MIPVLMIVFGLLLAGLTAYALMIRWRAEQQREAALTGRLDALKSNVFEFDQNVPDPVEAWIATLPQVIRTWIGAADIRVRRELVLGYAAAAIVAVIIAARFANPAVALGVLAAFLIIPPVLVRQLALYRLNKFAESLPYFLDALRQLMIVGNSFQQAFVRCVEQATPPVRRYLDPAMRRIRNGAPVPDAIGTAADRVASAELYMLASAVRMNLRFGGAIGPVLADLSELLRSRARVGRELKSATAEVRLSGLVLAVLPLAAIVIISLADPHYMTGLLDTHLGRVLLGVAAMLEVAGILILRRLTRLDF